MIDVSLQCSLSDDESDRVEEVNHTLTLDVEDPFELTTQVMFRHASNASSDGVEGWGTVMSLLTLPGGRGMTIDSMEIEAKVSDFLRRGADARTRVLCFLLLLLLDRERDSRRVCLTRRVG